MPDNRYFFFIAVLVRIGFRYTNFQGIKGGEKAAVEGWIAGGWREGRVLPDYVPKVSPHQELRKGSGSFK